MKVEGTGMYYSMGGYMPITWNKGDEYSQTMYYSDDEELKLNPGLTWILLVDDNVGVTEY